MTLPPVEALRSAGVPPMRPSTLFSIGEFSKATGLTVKTLRFYHDEGLLAPAHVDPETGYRYYAVQQLERARLIAALRRLEFPLAEIADVLRLDAGGDDAGLLDAVERHRDAIEEKARRLRAVGRELGRFIDGQRQARSLMSDATHPVIEKELPPLLIAGIRMKGRYDECGKAFGRIGRAFGRHIAGPPMLLHFDTEYKEADADFEAAFPLKSRPAKEVEGIVVRDLAGGRAITLVHKGPWDELGTSYAKITADIKARGVTTAVPSREVYLKGPGIIFKGNPKNYLTEIQMLVAGE